MSRLQPLAARYGRWTPGEPGPFVKGKRTVRCVCDCGKRALVRRDQLVDGGSKSCGCARMEKLRSNVPKNKTHGMSNSGTRVSWCAMIARCKPTSSKREYYFDRGITVCARWKKFENFLADMGVRPPGLTIERIDNDKGYFKDNCMWASRAAQCANRRPRSEILKRRAALAKEADRK